MRWVVTLVFMLLPLVVVLTMLTWNWAVKKLRVRAATRYAAFTGQRGRIK